MIHFEFCIKTHTIFILLEEVSFDCRFGGSASWNVWNGLRIDENFPNYRLDVVVSATD